MKFAVAVALVCILLLLVPVAISACIAIYNVSKILLSSKILFLLHIFLSRVVPHFLNKQRDITLLFVAKSHCSV